MSGAAKVGYWERVFHPEGGWVLEQAPQRRGHSTEPDRGRDVFGQHSWAHGGITGMSCTRPGVGLHESCGSLPTQKS